MHEVNIMELFRLINYLDEKLLSENFKDYAINGLQVENNGKIDKNICRS